MRQGNKKIGNLFGKTEEFLGFVVVGIEEGELSIGAAISYEDTIGELEKRSRNNHIERLNTGECAVRPGMIFIDMLHNFEPSNLSVAIHLL